LAGEAEGEPVDWLAFDAESLRVTVQGAPGPSDISLPVDANTVVEFLSR
jgi:small subunit ribosomal protein S4